jgi:hypothetical protein
MHAPADEAPGGPPLPAERIVTNVTLAASAFLLLSLLLFPYGRDQGVFAVIGQGILEGEAPYRDRWDLKPPGVFFLYAMARAVLGPGMWAIRGVEVAVILSLLPAFRILARRYLGTPLPGTFGFGVAILMHVQLDFWHTAQAESFGGVLIVWAIVCASMGGGPVIWGVAGALYGLAFVFKPFLAAGAFVALTLAALQGRSQGVGRRSTTWSGLPALIAGFALPGAATLGYFAAMGALPEMVEALFVFAPRYAAIDADRATSGWFLLFALRQSVVGFSNLALPGFALLLLLRPHPRGELPGLVHLGMIILLLLAGVAWQAKLFSYHYGAILPLLAALSGWGIWKAWILLRGTNAGIALFMAAFITLAGVPPVAHAGPPTASVWSKAWLRLSSLHQLGSDPPPELDALNSLNDVSATENRLVARWLRDHTPADGTLFVWGFQPVLYDLAARRPASRYITNQPQRVLWSRSTSRLRLMRDLRECPPDAIVVAHQDVFPRVVGNTRDSAAELEEFPELRDLLTFYEPAASIGRLDVYRRIAR